MPPQGATGKTGSEARVLSTDDRPDIEDGIKREVRQRCGFGCVMCGRPFYQYDHLLGWANVKRHVASEITLLCGSHHDEKTKKLLPNEIVIKANENPFNVVNSVTAPHTLYYGGSDYSIVIGGWEFRGKSQGSGTRDAIRMDGESLIGVRIEDDHFLLNLNIYNAHDELVLCIVDNELILNTCMWDIEVEGSTITIRERLRVILFEIDFQPPSSVVVRRGRFLRNGIELLVIPEWCALLNIPFVFGKGHTDDHAIGLSIEEGALIGPVGIRVNGIRRTGWDRKAAQKLVRTMIAKTQMEPIVNDLLNAESLD